MVFGAIAGGMFVRLGPTVGAVFTLLLAEVLRLALGHDIHGLDTTIYGLLLVLFIIFMPKGILGTAIEVWERRGRAKPATAHAAERPVPARTNLSWLTACSTRSTATPRTSISYSSSSIGGRQ